MRLVSDSALLSLLNITQSGGATDAGRLALDATFPLIEGATESRLVASSTTDTFSYVMGKPDQVLRLSSGFLSTDTATLTFAGDSLALPDTMYRINRQQGTILMIGSWTGRKGSTEHLSVRYEHGYDETEGLLDQDEVPEALKMAHTFMAAASMQLSPAAMARDKAKAMGIDASRGFQAMAQQILQSLHRPRGLVLWPIHSAS